MSEPYQWLLTKGPKVRARVVNRLSREEKNDFSFLWDYQARPEQLPPPGDWRIWMILAGRGFGKTRTGAEWVRMIADSHPEARIALISSSLAEARAVMVEGESGILAACRPDYQPRYEPSLHRIKFRNGAQAQLFSAAEPESLRGPQHSHACRAGAEGVFRQSGVDDPRQPAIGNGDCIASRSAVRSRRWRILPRDGPRR